MAADDRTLGAPVGIGQPNDKADVRQVQHLINRHLDALGGDGRLAEDGAFGPLTQARLTEYQRDTVRLAHPDAVVDVQGPTMRSLSRPVIAHHVAHPQATEQAPGGNEDAVERLTDRHSTQVHKSHGKRQFISEMLPHAQAVHEKYGVPVSVTLAQGALESQWGTKAPDNVYFGIKGYAPDGKSAMLMTHEEEHRVKVPKLQRFRAYDSMGAAADDYGHFLKSNQRYKTAFNHPDDGYAFMKELAANHYATDSQYYKDIAATMQANSFTHYDSHSPRLQAHADLAPLPANMGVSPSTPVAKAANPNDLQALWAAMAERGRQIGTARQSALASCDPVAAQIGSSLRSSENDAATKRDLNSGWKAAAQAGTEATAARQQTASDAPVTAPSGSRMKL